MIEINQAGLRLSTSRLRIVALDMKRRSSSQTMGIALLIMLIGGWLRFKGLGAWPFAGDETATLMEERSLFSSTADSPDSQSYRLPRLIPVAYGLIHLSVQLFGRDEFGSRVVGALLATLILGLIFLLLNRTIGTFAAIAASLLVMLWPDHIVQAQEARFYSIAAFFHF